MGNERVLEGRLEDAAFTFERDAALGVDRSVERLGEITFFAGAGRRLPTRRSGSSASSASSAATRSPAELRGWPRPTRRPSRAGARELEGHIGAEHMRLAGHLDDVCAAIDEQYFPDAAEAPRQ